MTDLPRRSYPLVVPPPGGFEDAVRRGRGRRRRAAGGSTGAALALAGVVAYASMHGNPGTSGLEPTRDNPPTEQPAPGYVAPSPSAEPTATPTAATESGAVSGPVVVAGPVVQGPAAPAASSSPDANVPAPAAPVGPSRPEPQPRPTYAPRSPIKGGQDPSFSTANCLENTSAWCARANARLANDGTTWTIDYTLCRGLNHTTETVRFDRRQQVDFSVVDTTNQDRVWTYSAGQPVVRSEATLTFDGGECTWWETEWNGYDDFGFTPRPGTYRLIARSTGTADDTLPTASAELELGR